MQRENDVIRAPAEKLSAELLNFSAELLPLHILGEESSAAVSRSLQS
jgi:hypothetical protein